MESWAAFQAKIQVKMFLLNYVPAAAAIGAGVGAWSVATAVAYSVHDASVAGTAAAAAFGVACRKHDGNCEKIHGWAKEKRMS